MKYRHDIREEKENRHLSFIAFIHPSVFDQRVIIRRKESESDAQKQIIRNAKARLTHRQTAA